MAGESYTFIDGGYLRLCFEERLRANFGDYHGIVFDQLNFGGQKTFFYDCLDDLQRDGETQSDYEVRVRNQEAEIEKIAGIPNWHVRLGTLSGNARAGGRRARRQQKEVDVLLAVDMLNHGFRQNFDRAVLVTGDLDFKPVVESLVQLGRCSEEYVGGCYRQAIRESRRQWHYARTHRQDQIPFEAPDRGRTAIRRIRSSR